MFEVFEVMPARRPCLNDSGAATAWSTDPVPGIRESRRRDSVLSSALTLLPDGIR
jgi:hypothetical protein